MISIDIVDDGKAWVDQSKNPWSLLGVDDDPKSTSNSDGAVGSDRSVSMCVEEIKDFFWRKLDGSDSTSYIWFNKIEKYKSWAGCIMESKSQMQYLNVSNIQIMCGKHLQDADKV